LAVATCIDGHNWLYPVTYAVFDSKTTENWKWFMEQLRHAIGTPLGLIISSDVCKGLASPIENVFLNVEHKEYMRHLMKNLKKRFHGEILATEM
jgi:MULE transposase domain